MWWIIQIRFYFFKPQVLNICFSLAALLVISDICWWVLFYTAKVKEASVGSRDESIHNIYYLSSVVV